MSADAARSPRRTQSPRTGSPSVAARRSVAAVLAALGSRHGAKLQLLHRQGRAAATIRDVVEATGTVNAVITVQVGSQVSGTIAKLNADFNSRVHKGDVDRADRPGAVPGRARSRPTADLENAKANVDRRARRTSRRRKADRGADQGRLRPRDRRTGCAENSRRQQALDLAKANYESAQRRRRRRRGERRAGAGAGQPEGGRRRRSRAPISTTR